MANAPRMLAALRLTLPWVVAALAGFVALAGSTTEANAEDRALIVGVNNYRVPEYSLQGVDLDVGMMKEITRLMGFKDSQVKTMLDEQATSSNVFRGIEDWLIKGAGPDDRVLFYFSGHGSQVPDEDRDDEDLLDEVLCLYDLAVVKKRGRVSLNNVLLDDQFYKLLGAMRSQKILVLLDCCHSGSAIKALPLDTRSMPISNGMVKFFHYEGMPLGAGIEGNFLGKPKAINAPPGVEDRYVAITACGENEKAMATTQGSIFTLGVRDAIRTAIREGKSKQLTPAQLQEHAADFIRKQLRKDGKVFHPQILGSPTLREAPLLAAVQEPPQGNSRKELEEVAAEAGASLKVRTNQDCFVLKDLLTVTVEVPSPGYLNVVCVGPDDTPTVLFPNKFHENGKVGVGLVTIPSKEMNFELVAMRPPGPWLVVAILSERPLNLFKEGFRDVDLGDIFAELSPKGMSTVHKFMVREKGKKGLASGKVVVKVAEDKGECR